MSEDDSNQLSNAGEEEISFGGSRGEGVARSAAKRFFENVDRAFNQNAVFIKIIPMLGATRDAGIKS